MKKLKMLLIICLALVIVVGCGKNDPKKPVDKPSEKVNEKETNVDYAYGEDIFTTFYEVNEKGIDKNLKNVELDNKFIKSFNLMKDNFEFPKTGESMKRTISIDEEIPLRIIDFVGSELRAKWYELIPDEYGYDNKLVGYTNEDKKFEKDKIYMLLIEFELKTGYDMYTYENMKEYPETEINTHVINRLYRLNGLPNREVRGPAENVGTYYGIKFFFPKTK